MGIGEPAAAAGPPTKTLRFYEESGLLPPTEGAANGYRDYGMEAMLRLVSSVAVGPPALAWRRSVR